MSRKTPKGFGFCTHPDVCGFSGQTRVYTRLRFKSCVYHFSHVFRDGQGNIKGQKMVQGVQGVCRGTGERPYKCDSPGVVKSAITQWS